MPQRTYRLLSRLHDLWVLLAWGGIIGGLMLNTFFHRNCLDYTNGDPLATCQTFWDSLFLLVAGVGAGLVLTDERAGLVGFLPALLLGSAIFVAFLQFPILGAGDPVLADTIVSRSLVLAFYYEFPFGIMVSFVGCMLGVLSKDRLESARIKSAL